MALVPQLPGSKKPTRVVLGVGGCHGGMIGEGLQRPKHPTSPSLVASWDAWHSLLETRQFDFEAF